MNNLARGAIILVFCFSPLAASALSGASEVFKWVDENGTVHFTEEAPESIKSERIVVDTRAAPSINLRNRAVIKSGSANRQSELHSGADRRIVAAGSGSADTDSRVSGARSCEDAGQQLSVLQVELPTYRDDKGAFHNTARWLADDYRGRREYLNDASREREIANMQQEIQNLCVGSVKPLSAQEANERRLRSEQCKIASTDLEAVLDTRTRTPRQEIRDRRRDVEEYCD